MDAHGNSKPRKNLHKVDSLNVLNRQNGQYQRGRDTE